jgi:tetratricopeptide (TPR) repeat protein
VIDACPNCKMHRETGLRQYRTMRRNALAEALEEMKNDPDNAEKAISGIQTFVSFGELDNFETIAPALAQRHRANGNVLRELAGAYEYIGNREEASRYYQLALASGNDLETHEDMAVFLIRHGRSDEAEPHLQHIIETGNKEKYGLLYFLVEGFRHEGKHQDALRILDRLETLDPHAAEDPHHQQLRTTSDAARQDNRPIPSPSIGTAAAVKEERTLLPSWLPHFVPASIVLLLIGIYLWSAFGKGSARSMWLLNGTSIGYTAVINGTPTQLRPNDIKSIKVAEGSIEIEVSGTQIPVDRQSVEFRTSFFSRPFKNPVVVINPDRQALLVLEETIYSSADPGLTPRPYELFCGEPLYVFDSVDYLFEEFPEEIQVGSSTDRIRKNRLYQHVAADESEGLLASLGSLTEDTMIDFLRMRATFYPESESTLSIYAAISIRDQPEELIENLQVGLSQRPVLVDWHRLYQSTMEAHNPDHDLVGEYRELVNNEPDEQILRYLLGRVIPDRSEAEKLFLASETNDGGSGHGYNAISYEALCAGQFEKAMKYADLAYGINPGRSSVLQTWTMCLLATEDYSRMLNYARDLKAENPHSNDAIGLETRALALMGSQDEEIEVIGSFVSGLEDQVDPEALSQLRNRLAAPGHYIRGDYSAYLSATEAAGDTDFSFQSALIAGDPAAAMAHLDSVESEVMTSYLLVYCQAKSQGKIDEAESALEAASELLQGQSSEYRELISMFDQDRAEGISERIKALMLPPAEKRVVAVALGLKHPELRTPCFAIAKRHNFEATFPQHLLKTWMHESQN